MIIKSQEKTPDVGGHPSREQEPFRFFIRVPVGRFGTTSSKKVWSADKETERLLGGGTI
jgi:hypothetical protein